MNKMELEQALKKADKELAKEFRLRDDKIAELEKRISELEKSIKT